MHDKWPEKWYLPRSVLIVGECTANQLPGKQKDLQRLTHTASDLGHIERQERNISCTILCENKRPCAQHRRQWQCLVYQYSNLLSDLCGGQYHGVDETLGDFRAISSERLAGCQWPCSIARLNVIMHPRWMQPCTNAVHIALHLAHWFVCLDIFAPIR